MNTQQPLTQAVPLRSHGLAFTLGLIFGPMGFFYFGWRFGLSGVAFFGVYCVTIAVPAVQDVLARAAGPLVWGIVHCIVVGIFAAIASDEWNRAVLRGKREQWQELQTTKFAILTTCTAYKAVQIATGGLAGVIIAVGLIADGKIGSALVALLIVTPVGLLLVGVLYALISAVLMIVVATMRNLVHNNVRSQ